MSGKGKDEQVIIIKKGGHGKHGHHGGAWKVAYADFVTAMMAFFLVMWIVGQSAEVKAGVAGYFRDPTTFTEGGGGNGVLPGVDRGTTGGDVPERNAPVPDVKTAQNALEQAAEQIKNALSTLPDFEHIKDQIEVTVTEEGLRIELLEAPDDGFFDSGSAHLKTGTVELLAIIAQQLRVLPNKVAVEGHTDARPYASTTGYSNWELSADRANSARRVLQAAGLNSGQVEAVRGFADTHLRDPKKPMDPNNRRISIVVRRS